MNKTTLWFTRGFSNMYQVLGDIRAADVAGKYRLLCSHPSPDFPARELADEFFSEPQDNGAGYVDFICHEIAARGVDVLIPTHRQALLDRNRKRIEALGCVLVTTASADTLDIINDKAALYDFLQGKGIVNIPEYRVATQRIEFMQAYIDLAYDPDRNNSGAPTLPVCFKPTRGVYGRGFRLLSAKPDTFADVLNEAKVISVDTVASLLATGNTVPLIVMRYLEGDERSVDCLAYKGRLVNCAIRHKSEVKGSAQVIESDENITNQVKALTRELDLNGMYNVQFKDMDGVPYLLEINPRLAGRSYYATMAGFNIPYLAAEIFSDPLADIADATAWRSRGLRVGNVEQGVVLSAAGTRV